MKKLYFIRHGQSVLNTERRLAGRIETPLTKEGREQAAQAGRQAKELGIDLIVSSPLSRALDTALIVAKEIGYPEAKIVVSDLILERDHGEAEGTPWSPDYQHRGAKGMETDEMLVERAHKAMDWIKTLDADTVLIVSHGAMGRALRSVIKEDFPMSHPHRLPNAEMQEWL